MRRWLARWVVLSLCIVACAFLLDRYGRCSAPDETFDAIVVLGCRVHRDGLPSAALRERTRRAVELWRQGKAPLIVFTGGIGDHPPSEARAAADLAMSLGVPERAMLLEDRSTSTQENAQFARERFAGRRVLLVSDAYHLFRSERVFQRYYDHVAGAATPTSWSTSAVSSVREVAACVIYLGLGRMDLFIDGANDYPPGGRLACLRRRAARKRPAIGTLILAENGGPPGFARERRRRVRATK